MKIGIFGAGNVGRALGKLLVDAGHEVMFTFVRDSEKLRKFIESIGSRISYGAPDETVRFADVVFLAVPWWTVRAALRSGAPWFDRVLVDCTNPFKQDFSSVDIGDSDIAAKLIEHWTRDASVVKAFNTLSASVLEEEGGALARNPPVIFYCGDDTHAKQVVAGLISDCRFKPMDTGVLSDARFQEPRGPLYQRVLRYDEAVRVLKQLGLYHSESGLAA